MSASTIEFYRVGKDTTLNVDPVGVRLKNDVCEIRFHKYKTQGQNVVAANKAFTELNKRTEN